MKIKKILKKLHKKIRKKVKKEECDYCYIFLLFAYLLNYYLKIFIDILKYLLFK